MNQTPTTFSAREALTQLRAAPTLSQASTPQGCPLQGLVTQALRPQALKTLAFAPQALLTWALTPQGEMDLELGHQAHQDQSGLTATSVRALSTLLHSTLSMTFFFFHSVGNVHFWLPHRCLVDSQYWLFRWTVPKLLKLSCFFVAVCTAVSAPIAKRVCCPKVCLHSMGCCFQPFAARLL